MLRRDAAGIYHFRSAQSRISSRFWFAGDAFDHVGQRRHSAVRSYFSRGTLVDSQSGPLMVSLDRPFAVFSFVAGAVVIASSMFRGVI
jgi:hypothetical protein